MHRLIRQMITMLFLSIVVVMWGCRNRTLTHEEYKRNFCEFVTNPFMSEFKRTGNLKQNIIRKFGKPLSVEKFYGYLGDHSGLKIDETRILYKGYNFYICKTKYYKIIRYIYISNILNIKYNITEETTLEDIEALFGKRTESRTDSYSKNVQCDGKEWKYYVVFYFKKNKLKGIKIEKRDDVYVY